MNASEICLVVVYNHNFERNIEVIKRIYAGRFSHVYQVMPFYRGTDPSVIGVYESSYQYSGYITQAASRIRDAKYSHYVFVADDMVINPAITEKNICMWLGVSPGVSFHPEIMLMVPTWCAGWAWGASSIVNFLSRSNACEWRGFLPSVAEARKRFERHGLDWRRMMPESAAVRLLSNLKLDPQNPYRVKVNATPDDVMAWANADVGGERLYPLARGFSDFFAIAEPEFDEFAHTCGVFAAMRMFVEVAIPTALILCSKEVRQLRQTGLKMEKGISDYRIREQLESRYGLSYTRLVREYPNDYLFIHPVKLSKWKDCSQ